MSGRHIDECLERLRAFAKESSFAVRVANATVAAPGMSTTVKSDADAGAKAKAAERTTPRGLADIALAALVVAIVATMIVPVPLLLLDVLLVLNLSISVLLLLVSLYIPDALGIASFPTILLVTTLYRLALDVAATRNILGRADGGEVIRAFGQFVVRGNYVVGGVVFVILTLVQFLVIAKGSERVAEVAARFTLDAMPGKQMAIDAELRAGAIDQGEARRRRRALARESQFYGSMDGAMKFVKGDAIAGIVITFINILGGLAIGVGQRGMDAGMALKRYGLLTIGEGLVAQIPALIVSTAAGILVTRVASEEPDQSLGGEIARQLVSQPRPLQIASVLLLGFAITPGMPAVPFLALAIVLGLGGRAVARAQEQKVRSAEVIGARSDGPQRRAAEPEKEREAHRPGVIPVGLDVGSALAGLVESAPGSTEAPLRALVPSMRDELFRELGVSFPGVRVRVSRGDLPPSRAVLSIHEVPCVERDLPAGKELVLAPPEALQGRGLNLLPDLSPEGDETAVWVDTSAADSLRAEGLLVLDHASVLLLALSDQLRRHAARFVGIQETQVMIDAIESSHPALVRNLVPKPVTVALLADVLRRLVEEGVCIRNLRDILEALGQYAAQEKDPTVLADLVRQSLRREISHRFAPGGRLRAWVLDPMVTDAIREAIVRSPAGNFLRLDPRIAEELRNAAVSRIGLRPAVLVADPDVRRYVWLLFDATLPRLRVVSPMEFEAGTLIEPLGTVGP